MVLAKSNKNAKVILNMKQTSTKNILAQTRDIYNAIAPDFSDTRGRWWRGFGSFNRYTKPGDKVLDLGCGNGRMAEIFADSKISYLGIDNSEELIKIARERFKDQSWVKFEVGDILGDSWVPVRRLAERPESQVERNDGSKRDSSTSPVATGFARNDNGSEQFDMVLLIAVLHHVPTRKLRLRVLENVYDSLKPGGRLVISNWNLWQAVGDHKNFRYYKRLFNYYIKISRGVWGLSDAFVPWKPLTGENLRYVHSFRKGEMKRLLNRAGFDIDWIKYEAKNGQATDIWRGDNLLAVAIKK
jgi:tRNA (uracil-5-)-methyltransferase TRM9